MESTPTDEKLLVTLTNGATAAGFRIIRLLGAGGMGEVYLAEHPRLPRREALKVLAADVSADPEFRERFTRESDLAATLWHPHIVGLHDRGESDGRLWISMDYVDGADTARLLRDNYPTGMTPREVVEIICAIGEALDYAHSHGLCHRDVKPGNILLSRPDFGKRRILLADFGVARRLDDISGLTQTDTTVGTVRYAAPEQLMGHPVDGRADQYALAATAFHLLTGSPPFQSSNPAVVIGKHLNEPPPRLAEVRPELAGFDAALFRALAKDPSDRFPRCQDFANALYRFYADGDQQPNPTDVAGVAPSAPTEAEIDAAAGQARAAPAPAGARQPAPGTASARPGRPLSGAGGAVWLDSWRPMQEMPAAWQRRQLRRRHPIRRAVVLTLVILTLAVTAFVIFVTLLFPDEQQPPSLVTPSPASTATPTPLPSREPGLQLK